MLFSRCLNSVNINEMCLTHLTWWVLRFLMLLMLSSKPVSNRFCMAYGVVLQYNPKPVIRKVVPGLKNSN